MGDPFVVAPNESNNSAKDGLIRQRETKCNFEDSHATERAALCASCTYMKHIVESLHAASSSAPIAK